ncbi:MAG: FkbM family methyltransferase [Methylocystis sp.]|nr:FkbM family methyltransferase [Methylocystis sp.]
MAAEQDVDSKVQEAFFQDSFQPGVLVEVGAAHPDFLSIGASFRKLGWKVVAIEPNPDFCAAHRALGHRVYEYACSDIESDNADFFVVDSQGTEYLGGNVSFESFSSLGVKDEFAALYETVKDKTKVRTIPVKVRKLDTILAEHEPEIDHIDILAVDVEGWELNVMRGFSIAKYQPRVIILENLFKRDEYVVFMNDAGYQLWRRLEPNDVYVSTETLKKCPQEKTGWTSLVGKLAKLFQIR